MLTAEQIRELFQMRPHPIEGGFFAETYRGVPVVPQSLLPGYPGDRAISTAIYYLLTPDTFSAMHRVRGDEMFHFYLGDPVEMLQLKADGSGEAIVLGQDIALGMRLQHNVPGGVSQRARRIGDGCARWYSSGDRRGRNGFDGNCSGSKACRDPPPRNMVEQHNWQLTVGTRSLTYI